MRSTQSIRNVNRLNEYADIVILKQFTSLIKITLGQRNLAIISGWSVPNQKLRQYYSPFMAESYIYSRFKVQSVPYL